MTKQESLVVLAKTLKKFEDNDVEYSGLHKHIRLKAQTGAVRKNNIIRLSQVEKDCLNRLARNEELNFEERFILSCYANR